ncbi:HD domain-containing protein [Patescibacteria group bacterium AH-259-L05]|nr:HD domain-containing protein [Patescibacteria group bacterium AH-259-L05]
MHDVIEDSDISYEDLQARFGKRVADTVRDLSKNKELPRKEMFDEYHERLKNLPKDILKIKLLDRLDNLRYLHLSPIKGKKDAYIRNTEKHYLPLAKKIDKESYDEMVKIINNLKESNNL